MKPPNIVLCLTDQLRAFSTGCYGNPWVRTPHIDGLAAQSVRFANAITNNPVCMAARSALLSGQYSRSCTGQLGNDFATTNGKGWGAIEPECPEADRGAHLPGITLPEALQQTGYQTAAIGKWHIRPAPAAVGFDHSILPLTNHRHSQQQYSIDGAAPKAAAGFGPEREIEWVEAFLADRGKTPDTPFFLYYNIMPPHMPLGDMPDHYLGLYDPRQIPLRPNVSPQDKLPWDEEWFKIYLWDYIYYHYRQPHTLELPAGFDIKVLTALYYGAVAWVDDLVGRLLHSLQAYGLDENTIVVFAADHGDNLGSHHQWNKGMLLEESTRIPLLCRFPDRWPAAVNHTQVAALIDIMPTLLEACGQPIPEHVQGQSLLPILTDQCPALKRNWACIETSSSSTGKGHTEIGLRTPRHLYGMRLETGSGQLVDADFCFYDLASDPYQFSNQMGAANSADTQARLKQSLLAWHQHTPWLEHPDSGPDRSHLFDPNGLPRPGPF
ncbi:MAG: sulfatase-like hydrolase/transferase [Candidatus Latescibacteria bacterium]|nr:sulfatase-like hydrolase/transferase [Candidatus Latescibacterota bacterium]